MRDKLEKSSRSYAELEQKLADPAVVSDPKEYARVAKSTLIRQFGCSRQLKYITALMISRLQRASQRHF